jgi:LPS O-antigen subunit length determinant protein (WzzB/FepE family)
MDQTRLGQIIESSIYAWRKKDRKLDLLRNPLTNQRYLELKQRLIEAFGEEAKYIKRSTLESKIRKIILQKKFEDKLLNGEFKPKDHLAEEKIMYTMHRIRVEIDSLSRYLDYISEEIERL